MQLLPRRIRLPRDATPCGPYHEEREIRSPDEEQDIDAEVSAPTS